MRTTPGSLPWLIVHDARLGARRLDDILPNISPVRRRLVIAVAVLVLHALAWPVARWIKAAETDPAASGMLLGGLAAVLAFAASWMLAQSLLAVTRVLYVRGDLDLMLSAPLAAGKVVAARGLGLAAENFASSGIFLLPVAHALALQGHLHWLALYPTLLAMALAAAAFGLGAALGLFRLIGARRARAVSQVVAMLIGATVALGIQALAVLPRDLRLSLLGSLDLTASASSVDLGRGIWIPLQAARGEPQAVLLLLVPALCLFVVAVRTLGPAFTACVLRSAGTDLQPRTLSARRQETRFSAAPRFSIRAKELRLLMRDPWILGQLVLQLVYTLPVALILWQSGIGQAIPAVAVTPSLVIIAAQMAGSLAWIAISGEDAPEFMATAPMTRANVELLKLEVIAVIVGGVLLVPLALLALSAPMAGLVALACCASAAASCALVNLWHPSDGRRRSFMRRHAQSKLIGLFEHALLLLWAITAALAQMGLMSALAPGLLALLVLAMARRVLIGRAGGAAKHARPAAQGAPPAAAAA